jgi:transcriptional regulator with XRE-family HTH domain
MPSPLINRFLSDAKRLKLRFPVAEISKATGFTKSNVSGFLNGKRVPSDAFLKKFYSVYYPDSGITEDMYTAVLEPESDYSKDQLIEALQATIDAQKVTIKHLQEKVELLESKQDRRYA